MLSLKKVMNDHEIWLWNAIFKMLIHFFELSFLTEFLGWPARKCIDFFHFHYEKYSDMTFSIKQEVTGTLFQTSGLLYQNFLERRFRKKFIMFRKDIRTYVEDKASISNTNYIIECAPDSADWIAILLQNINSGCHVIIIFMFLKNFIYTIS